jgi:hypothetical protein
MGDCFDKARRRPDGGHGLSGWTTVQPEFLDFQWKSFLFESRVRTVRHCRLDSCTSAASNFLIKASRVRTKGMTVRTVDLLQAISISTEHSSGPWQTGVRTVGFELRFLPYGVARLDENPRRLDGCSNLPLFELGKKIWSSITESRPDGLLTRPNGCKLEQKLLDTDECPDENPRRPEVWCFVCRASGWYGTSSGRLELWKDERPDRMTCRPNGWQGTDFSVLQTVQNLWNTSE